jgi:methanogenic corrinoid protein MtbC1
MSYKELDLEDLYLQMQDDLYDGIREEIPVQVYEALARGQTPQQILDGGLVAGMDIVGVDFRDGILFVPEVLMSANAMKAGMEVLRPLLVETGAPRVGTMVVATVKGDIHDIGKNLVAMMMEGAGFEVINLGINCDADKFIAAIKEHKPDIIGMSALLTTTMPYMKVVVDALGEEGIARRSLRDGRRRTRDRKLCPRRRRRCLWARCRRQCRDRQGVTWRARTRRLSPRDRPSMVFDRSRPEPGSLTQWRQATVRQRNAP